MKSKHLYNLVLTAGIAALSFVGYLFYNTIQSTQSPEQSSRQALFYFDVYGYVLSFLILGLLSISAFVAIQEEKYNLFLASWIVYVVAAIPHYFVMTEAYFVFIKKNGLWAGQFQAGGIIGIIAILFWAFVSLSIYKIIKHRNLKRQLQSRTT